MILDTNALSAWLDGDPSIGRILETATTLKLNFISLGEYRFGLLSSKKRTIYEKHLALIETDVAILFASAQTSHYYAAIRHELKIKGRPIPSNDLWIAALAREQSLPILSRDSHFDEVTGLKRIGW